MRLAVVVAVCLVGCAHSRDTASARADVGSSTATPQHDTSDVIQYPPTRADPVKDVIHGVVVPDPYRWLEDGDAPEVVAWSHAQDDLARGWIARLPELAAFEGRFATLLRSGGEGRHEPTHAGSRYFFLERPTEADRLRLVYTEGLHGSLHVVIDSLAWRADGTLSLGDWWVTPDGKWVAYQVKEANLDASILRVMNVDTREVLPESIDGADLASVRWLPDDSGFFYMQVPTAPELHGERFAHARIRFHRLRDPSTADATARDASPSAEDPKPQDFQEEALSEDGRWLLVKVGRPGVGTGADFYFQDRREAHPRWRTLVEGFSRRSWAEAYQGRFYLVANDLGAQHSFVIDPDRLDRSAWKEIALAHDGLAIDEWNLVGGRLAFTYAAQAVRRAEIHDLDGRLVRAIPSPSLGVTSLPHGRPDDDDAFFTFGSFIQPQTIFHTSIARGTTEEWHRRSIPFDSDAYEIEQEFFASKDGTRVPMFLVHKKGLARDGRAPTLLTGYGGFAISQFSDFSVADVPWLEAGGVLVSVNLRGGLEYGEAWHRDGMGRAKQHVFDDFIAAAETLVRERVTSPAHLVSSGFSNGGLLVAAAMVQRPDLFAAVICDQPLTEMVRFAKYGKGGTGEYGDPADPADFAALFAYSPLHHVVPGTRYPPVLITASEKDERAHPMHARKFAAALQAATRGGPVLLRVQWNVGHVGGDSRPAYAEKIAQEYAFAMRFAR